VLIAQLWPGVTPLNVWDLELGVWCLFAMATDQHEKQLRQQARRSRTVTRGRGNR